MGSHRHCSPLQSHVNLDVYLSSSCHCPPWNSRTSLRLLLCRDGARKSVRQSKSFWVHCADQMGQVWTVIGYFPAEQFQDKMLSQWVSLSISLFHPNKGNELHTPATTLLRPKFFPRFILIWQRGAKAQTPWQVAVFSVLASLMHPTWLRKQFQS